MEASGPTPRKRIRLIPNTETPTKRIELVGKIGKKQIFPDRIKWMAEAHQTLRQRHAGKPTEEVLVDFPIGENLPRKITRPTKTRNNSHR